MKPEQQTLQDLREPLEQPGVLPADVSLIDSMIATHPPKILRGAMAGTGREYVVCERLAGSPVADRVEQLLDRQLNYYGQQEAVRQGDQSVAQSSAHDHPDVQQTKDRLVTQESRRLYARLRMRELESDVALRQSLHNRYRQLGKRGRVAVYIAGAALSATAWLGASMAVGEAPQAPTASMSLEERSAANAEVAGYKSKQILRWFPLALGGGATIWAAGAFSDRFAHRRAKKDIADRTNASE